MRVQHVLGETNEVGAQLYLFNLLVSRTWEHRKGKNVKIIMTMRAYIFCMLCIRYVAGNRLVWYHHHPPFHDIIAFKGLIDTTLH